MAHSLTSLHVHLTFSTHQRRPLIRGEMKSRLFAYMGGIVRELKSKPVMINGVEDHVHLLVSISPTLSVADLLRVVKTNSSRWMNEQTGHRRFAWQTGYSAFSVSTSILPKVTTYIREQEQHHHTMSYKEELLLLLKKHGVEYDERFLWQ